MSVYLPTSIFAQFFSGIAVGGGEMQQTKRCLECKKPIRNHNKSGYCCGCANRIACRIYKLNHKENKN